MIIHVSVEQQWSVSFLDHYLQVIDGPAQTLVCRHVRSVLTQTWVCRRTDPGSDPISVKESEFWMEREGQRVSRGGVTGEGWGLHNGEDLPDLR